VSHPADPEYQGDVPNLDGTEGHSEHILFGTNVKLDDPPEGEGWEGAAKEEQHADVTGTTNRGEEL
jgi:hypothetical protein